MFNSALNPEARQRRRQQEEVVVEKVEEKVEHKPVEEKPVVEEKPAEEKPAEEAAQFDARDKKKKKKGTEEVTKEDLLERPENALSLNEYLEQLKQKNQNISQTKKSEAVPAVNNDLQVKAQNDAEFEIGLSNAAKKNKKTKDKKPETKEKTLDFSVRTEAPTEKKFENRGNKRNQGNGTKFNFNDEEFPQL